ncbi:DUF4270 domain-containing protein [Parapedobacter sp. ISTM3]|uniref:DUF4270 domain-containing protein n=1 Tax=Parapedobacter sp. ISTM3 TaxID=2800130 RepID=UPI00190343A2|nr:DUF4270 domain-containing protein [Parapedobacter sp. ISTM3]MBK1440160.1 DUF4270 domain-containing protein [Parapedobacter sp. ISTM3]
MRYHTKDLLTLLISLFVLGGCTNPSGIGLDVNPGDEIVGTLTDTLTLHAVTLRDDSTRSSSFNQTVFGWFDDPVIGKTVADMALAIGRPTAVPRLRPDAEIDSVILVLPYGTEYFGDTLNPFFSLQVRQLDEAYTDGNFSSKQWSVREAVIGSKTINRFAYKQSDSVSITKHIDGKDSLVKEIPQLRLALSPEFFKELLSESVDSATLSTDAGFNNHVKGLYLSVDDAAMNGVGGLVTLRGIVNMTGIELTYRQPNGKEGDDAAIDTVRTFLPTTIQDGFSGATYHRLSSSIKRTYTADVLAQLENPEGNYGQLYLQAPAGLRARLRIPYIDALKGRNIAVNKAELVLYVDSDASNGGFDLHAPRLTLYREDIAGQRQPIPDGDSRASGNSFTGDGRSLWYRYGNWRAFGGLLDTEKQRYVFHLTSFVQDVLMGRINRSEFFIAPAGITDNIIPYHPTLNNGGRAIISNLDDPNVKMKLNIYYTQIGD